jgi:hypothetical protein
LTYGLTSSLLACASGLSGRMQRNSLDMAAAVLEKEREIEEWKDALAVAE